MSEFGDFEDSDAFDPSPPDPEQVARKLHRYRIEANRETFQWESLTDDERDTLVAIVSKLIDWLRREGSLR